MLSGLALGAIGLGTFTYITDTSSWVTSVLPGELLMSVGLALVMVPLSSLALTGVNDDDAGVASAVLCRSPSPFTVSIHSARRDPRLSRRVLDRGRADFRGVRGRPGPSVACRQILNSLW
jgi:hypothetical protein